VELVIAENEKQSKLDITCVSIYDKEAVKKSAVYKKTKFIFVTTKLLGCIPVKEVKEKNVFTRFLDKRGYNSCKIYDRIVYERIKNTDFDYLIFEGGDLLRYCNLTAIPGPIKLARILCPYVADERYRIFDKFLATSDFMGNYFYNETIDRDKVITWYNGVDISCFDKKISLEEHVSLKKKSGIPLDNKVLIFCGRLMPEKGIKELIYSFKKVLTTHPNTTLLIVGNANFKEQIKTEYDEELREVAKGILDKVIFTGFVDNNELYKYYQIADISVIPSQWEEAFCLVATEAMASGLPLVCSNSGALPEITTPQNAIIVKRGPSFVDDYAEKLNYLLENPTIAKNMGKSGIQQAKQFSSQRYYSRLLEILTMQQF